MKSNTAMLFQGLRRNVLAGARLALFFPVSRYDFRISAGDFVLLWACNLLAWVAGGMLRGGVHGYLDTAVLPLALAEIPLVLLASLFIASLYRRRELLLALALLLISPDVLLEIVSSAIVIALRFADTDAAPALQLTAYLVYFAWVLAIALRALWVSAGWHRWHFVQGSVLLVVLSLALVNFMPRTEFWVPYLRESIGAPPSAILQEKLFHAQGGLLDARLAVLRPQRPGTTDLYFVGFAPHGTQDVFSKELAAVSSLLEERFDAGGRTLVLGNDPATLGSWPIASATNLGAALARVGEILDANEDVLFLYVSTHGLEGGALSVELPPLQLAQIRPAALARMLAQSGIKWKVLVISACYSGGFIEPLRDENTLVITATDASSESFGCDHGQDFTWYGKAYFDEALRHTHSLTEAFESARQAVARREREQNLPASNPQMYVGAAIKGKLAELEARLKAQM